jgi:hypothetical protein
LFNVCKQGRQRVSTPHGSEKNNNSRYFNKQNYTFPTVDKEVPRMEASIGENIH